MFEINKCLKRKQKNKKSNKIQQKTLTTVSYSVILIPYSLNT